MGRRREKSARARERERGEGAMGVLHSTPSIVVTLARVALALSLSPLAAAAGAGVLFFSCPRRLWEVLVDESDKVDEKEKKKKRKVLAALLLVPIGALLSIPLGLICGVFFALLCALFGPGAPEEPLSCDSYSKTRHDTLSEEEETEGSYDRPAWASLSRWCSEVPKSRDSLCKGRMDLLPSRLRRSRQKQWVLGGCGVT